MLVSREGDPLEHFACRQCGQCCREPGYVYLMADEVTQISDYLGIGVAEFTREYTRLTENRRALSLREHVDGACVFLNEQQQCGLQDVKPLQCRLFPHGWRYLDMATVCPGWSGLLTDEHQ